MASGTSHRPCTFLTLHYTVHWFCHIYHTFAALTSSDLHWWSLYSNNSICRLERQRSIDNLRLECKSERVNSRIDYWNYWLVWLVDVVALSVVGLCSWDRKCLWCSRVILMALAAHNCKESRESRFKSSDRVESVTCKVADLGCHWTDLPRQVRVLGKVGGVEKLLLVWQERLANLSCQNQLELMTRGSRKL